MINTPKTHNPYFDMRAEIKAHKKMEITSLIKQEKKVISRLLFHKHIKEIACRVELAAFRKGIRMFQNLITPAEVITHNASI